MGGPAIKQQFATCLQQRFHCGLAAEQLACLQHGLHLVQAGCQRPHCMVLCMGLSCGREGTADGREGDVRGQKLHAGRSSKTLQHRRYSLDKEDSSQQLDNGVLPGHHAETQHLRPTRHRSYSSLAQWSRCPFSCSHLHSPCSLCGTPQQRGGLHRRGECLQQALHGTDPAIPRQLLQLLRQACTLPLPAPLNQAGGCKPGCACNTRKHCRHRLCCLAQSTDQPEHVSPTDAAQVRLIVRVLAALTFLDKHQLQLTRYLGSSLCKGPAMKFAYTLHLYLCGHFCTSTSESLPRPVSAACQRPPGLPNSPLATASASCLSSACGRAAAHCSVAAADDMASLAMDEPCITALCR